MAQDSVFTWVLSISKAGESTVPLCGLFQYSVTLTIIFFSPYAQLEFLLFQFVPIALWPAPGHQGEEPGSITSTSPLSVIHTPWLRFPWASSAAGWTALSTSPCMSRAPIVSYSSWSFSRLSLAGPHLFHPGESSTRHSTVDVSPVLHRGEASSQSAGETSPSTVHQTTSHLCCWLTVSLSPGPQPGSTASQECWSDIQAKWTWWKEVLSFSRSTQNAGKGRQESQQETIPNEM